MKAWAVTGGLVGDDAAPDEVVSTTFLLFTRMRERLENMRDVMRRKPQPSNTMNRTSVLGG